MVGTLTSKSAQIRARVGHPIIDGDGHTMELLPVFQDVVLDYARELGGAQTAERLRTEALTYDQQALGRWQRMSLEERRDTWSFHPAWGYPSQDALDRATTHVPRLLRQRLDELGIDFTILYPSQGMYVTRIPDPELRRIACRAVNSFYAELYRDHAQRMTPAAIIPMDTPQEAIEELEYAVRVLGLKAIVIGHVRRPIAAVQREYPQLTRYAYRIDTFGLDSEYDYDPFWARCVELGVAPTSHAGTQGTGARQSISNYMYNHPGHLGDAGAALCKALILGGVVRRFPSLKVAFLECGVGWAVNHYAQLIGNWEKRNPSVQKDLDVDRMMELIAEYGDERIRARLDRIRDSLVEHYQAQGTLPAPGRDQLLLADDWALAQIERAEDFRDIFDGRFFFGCEADDPMNTLAFNTRVNPFGARLHAIFSSDIGHWDAPVLANVVAEAYELDERELITPEDFRDFMFTYPATLHAGMNPNFFKGTICEANVAKLMEG
jgi:predicted TIM-barrel fold metal-dependent hydrolase